MWSTSSLPSLPGPFWPRVVAPDRALSIGQIELNCTYAKLNYLKKELFWHLTVCQQNSMLNWIVWNRTVFMNKMDLALNNLQRLMCHKTKSNLLTNIKNILLIRLSFFFVAKCSFFSAKKCDCNSSLLHTFFFFFFFTHNQYLNYDVHPPSTHLSGSLGIWVTSGG